MPNYLTSFLLMIVLAMPVWAQEDEAGEAADTAEQATGDATAAGEPAESEDAGDVADQEIDDSDLDEQTYEEDDDDFVPTEEIPADEPIPFPSNI